MMDNNNKKMIPANASNELLYSHTLLVRLANSKSEEKCKRIHITVGYQTVTVPTHKTELIIKLTDDQDPFFLYSLYMSEEDYQTLKCQQNLLIDFAAFGQRFVDLLISCDQDEKSDSPKFQLQLFTKEPLPFDHNNASLNIIEINSFKHLNHLQLQFMPGNDTDVKKYLATCLQTLRENYSKLSKEYEETKANLTQKLESTQQVLSSKNIELDKLKVDIDTQNERLNTRYMQELNSQKEKSMQAQYDLQQKYEKDKKDMEANFIKIQNALESRLNELEISNKDLLDRRYKNESQIQELRSKYGSMQEEYNQMKQDLIQIRKQNTTLDTELHTNEKTLNHMRTRIAVLEQEVKDKDELVQRTQDLLNNEQGQKKVQDGTLNEKNNEIKKLQASLKHVSQELLKGNEIISKLQAKLRAFNIKMKLKNEILTQQEKVLLEKDKEFGQIKQEFKEAQENLQKYVEENKELKISVNKKTHEVDEAATLLKRNEQMINWLNKQITELNMNGNGTVGANAVQALQFKPYGALINTNPSLQTANIITPRGGGSTNNSEQMSQNYSVGMNGAASSNSSGANSTNGMARSTSATRSYNTTTNNEYLNEQQQQVRQYLPSSTNTVTIPTNTNTTARPPTALNATQQSTHSTRSLDPKYFQPTSPIDTLNTNGLKTRLNSTTTAVMTNGVTNIPNNNTLTNPMRINKQLIQQTSVTSIPVNTNAQIMPTTTNGTNNFISSKSTPALASAYFPTN